MLKKISIIILGMLVLFVFLGCAKPAETPPEQPAPAAAESPADEIGAGISDISSADEELDTSELDDLDATLGDIENI